MYVHGHLFGGAPVLAKIQIGEVFPHAGVPVLAPDSGAGVKLPTTASAVSSLGIALDAQPVRNTAQQLGNAYPAAYVTVSVRRDQIVRSRLSGGTTSKTALPEFRNTLLSTNGLLVTAPFGVEYVDGTIFGATGANAGKLRRMDDPDVNTAAIIGIAFPFDISVGDLFYAATFGPYEQQQVEFTSDFTEVNATENGQGNSTMRCTGLFFQPKNAGGAMNSYAELVFTDHWFDGD
jgi:hypothetical protein